ncbi:hypothetical protein C1645_839627 [Glomus cerebriforme]|uniref:tRNA-intron lyase n=1 Tax=Glomus cerebriforme TaxID=658196 RepID=A0A397S6G2_9GLOM|nr:hypothetical protein C1645_839627 [Glomus cerebriforme]
MQEFTPVVNIKTFLTSFTWYNYNGNCFRYYITNGIKFGSDYLLYSENPLRYHSYFIAIVLDIDKIISSMDIIIFGCLRITVKKSYILYS